MKRKPIVLCCLIALVILALILWVTLGIVPRDYGIRLVDTHVQTQNVKLTPDGITVPITVQLMAHNACFYSITISQVQFKGSADGYANLVSGYLDEVYLPARDDAILITVPMTLTYSTKKDPGAAFLRKVADTCKDPANSIPMVFQVRGYYSWYLSKGNAFALDHTESIPCAKLMQPDMLRELGAMSF